MTRNLNAMLIASYTGLPLAGSAHGVARSNMKMALFKDLVRPLYRRMLLLWFGFASAGAAVYVNHAARVRGAGRITLGSEVHIHRGCVLDAEPCGRIELADGCRIGPNATLQANATGLAPAGVIRIGRNGYVGPQAILHGDGGLTIGADVLISPQVVIMTHNHGFTDLAIPMRLQPETYAPVVIEDDVWLGAGVKVMQGVRIGHSAIVGAGAVVTRDVPPMAVAAGVPAQVLKYRSGA